MSIESGHQLGAAVLATALMELFPEAQWMSGEGTPSLFFGDVLFPFAFKKEFLPLIEEKMRLISKEERSVSLIEMVPSNAAELLKNQGQHLLAEEVRLLEQATVTLCRIGHTVSYLPQIGAVASALAMHEIKLFLIPSVRRQGKMVTRIVGLWEKDKQQVKQRVKELSSLQLHEELSSGLLSPLERGWAWLPQGVVAKKSLMDWIQAKWKKQGISLVSLPFIDGGEEGWVETSLNFLKKEPHLRWGTFAGMELEGEEEGFISPGIGIVDRAVFLCKEPFFEQELISSLQFILEIPKILGFESKIVVSVLLDAPRRLRQESLASCEKALKMMGVQWRVEKVRRLPYLVRIEVQIQDALGRDWMGPFIGIPKQDQRALCFSLCYSLERMAALLLEKKRCFNMRSTDSEPAN